MEPGERDGAAVAPQVRDAIDPEELDDEVEREAAAHETGVEDVGEAPGAQAAPDPALGGQGEHVRGGLAHDLADERRADRGPSEERPDAVSSPRAVVEQPDGPKARLLPRPRAQDVGGAVGERQEADPLTRPGDPEEPRGGVDVVHAEADGLGGREAVGEGQEQRAVARAQAGVMEEGVIVPGEPRADDRGPGHRREAPHPTHRIPARVDQPAAGCPGVRPSTMRPSSAYTG